MVILCPSMVYFVCMYKLLPLTYVWRHYVHFIVLLLFVVDLSSPLVWIAAQCMSYLLMTMSACVSAAASVLTAVLAKFMFTYGWSWNEALMFGAILSATDPVAVVALLRDIG